MPRGSGRLDLSIEVPCEVMAAVRQHADTITCAQCFEIAERTSASRRIVGEAANRAGIRIAKCQLGCFD
jgi:hypothetical protein